MSRYNPLSWQFTKPLFDVLFLVVVVPAFVILFFFLRLLYGADRAIGFVDKWLDDKRTTGGLDEDELSRAVVELHDVHGLSFGDIAMVLPRNSQWVRETYSNHPKAQVNCSSDNGAE